MIQKIMTILQLIRKEICEVYLSRVEIDTQNRQKIHDLTHLGAYHNWIEQSFPNEIANKERLRHLWRIDELNNKQYILLVSEDKPDLEKLETYGVKGSAKTKDYTSYLNKLAENQVLRFKLTANPTYRTTKGAKKGRVVPHVTIGYQMKWLLDRTEENGFEIVQDKEGTYSCKVANRDWVILRKKIIIKCD